MIYKYVNDDNDNDDEDDEDDGNDNDDNGGDDDDGGDQLICVHLCSQLQLIVRHHHIPFVAKKSSLTSLPSSLST